jgi:hypothetical protein
LIHLRGYSFVWIDYPPFFLLSIAVVKAYDGTSDGHLNRWDSHF